MKRREDLALTAGLAGAFFFCSVGAGYCADALGLVKNGNAAGAPACSSCHGLQGEGNSENGFPRLAGMNAAYLVRQLNDLADDRRASDIMSSVAKSLSPEERQAAANYYASQEPPPATDAKMPDADLLARGRAIATVGLWDKGLPACGACHGSLGQGVGDAFPRLSGQSAKYVEDQLAAFADRTRHSDPMHLMGGVAGKLTKDDASAVAAYYSDLAATSDKKESK